MFVSVNKLVKRYGDFTAVDNLSFDVNEGEIYGFLGPNGAGKSTTLNVMCGLTDFNGGEVNIAGLDLHRDSRKIKALIGVVPQEIALYPTLSAYDNVAFFASLYGIKGAKLRKNTLEALEFVGLADDAKKRAGKMSGGMQRRLNIAAGIAHKPRLIVMDEPTVGVDAQSRLLIMNAIRTLRQGGATVIYTSHYMPEVRDICDRVAIIDGGKLAASGTQEELLKHVTDIKTIIIDVSAISEKVKDTISAMPDVKRLVYNADTHQLRVDVALRFNGVSALLSALLADGVSVDNLKTESPSLETTFLALTGKDLH